MSDAFTRRKLEWLDRIARDRNVNPLAFRVAYLLGNYFNRESGEAWPTHKRLGADVGVTRRAIQKAIDQLVEQGYLSRSVNRGRGGSNRYRPVFDNANASAHHDGRKCEPRYASTDEIMRTERQANANGRSAKCEPVFAQNPFIEHSEEPNEGDISIPPSMKEKRSDSFDDAFEEFWFYYPKKLEKARAHQIYRNLLEEGKAAVEELLAGVKRYAAQRDGQDPKYTKHPRTWLTHGCWADEPDRPSWQKSGSGFANAHHHGVQRHESNVERTLRKQGRL